MYIMLETKINFQNAVTFVLVKLNTKCKVQNSLRKRLLLLYLNLIYLIKNLKFRFDVPIIR